MLAYYLWWQMARRLEGLFKTNGKGNNSRWTLGLAVKRLKSLRRQTIVVGGVKCHVFSTPDEEQSKILDLLRGKLYPYSLDFKST